VPPRNLKEPDVNDYLTAAVAKASAAKADPLPQAAAAPTFRTANPALRPSPYDSPAPAPAANGELDLFSFVILQRRHLRRTAILAVAGFALAYLGVSLVKPRYTATAVVVVPPQTNPATMALRASGLDFLGTNSYDLYLDLMRSRTLATRLVNDFHLTQHYHVNDPIAAQAIVIARTRLESSKDGVLRVTVQDENAQVAADVANGYIAELDHMNETLQIGSASQQRAFYEKQMIAEKNALADAEVQLKKTQEQTGELMPESQALGELSAVENTRAQLRAKQVQLEALSQGATGQNPEVQRLRAEIGGLEGQLRQMQSGSGGLATGTPAAKQPGVALEYMRNLREVKFHESLFEMLEKEFEAAREQEARDISLVQMLDPAIPAKHKSWPPRALYCLIGLILGGALGVFYTVFEGFLEQVMRNPENRAKLAQLEGK
jgi:uncharacterized protein involved in exopolysaccharide biosynthesis